MVSQQKLWNLFIYLQNFISQQLVTLTVEMEELASIPACVSAQRVSVVPNVNIQLINVQLKTLTSMAVTDAVALLRS